MTLLEDVSKGLGIEKDEIAFASDILTYCGIAAIDLYQVGVIKNYSVTDKTEWTDLECVLEDPKDALLSYFVLVVKLHFDPPQPSMVATFKASIDTLLERLRTLARSLELGKGG